MQEAKLKAEVNDVHIVPHENTPESHPLDQYLDPKYQRFLMCDFAEIFNDNSWAHFYIFLYAILTFVTLLFIVFLQNNAIPKFVVIGVLHIAFLAYVISVKPFRSKWSNFRTMLLHTILIIFIACDLVMVGSSQYYYGLELAIVIAICLALIASIVFYVI